MKQRARLRLYVFSIGALALVLFLLGWLANPLPFPSLWGLIALSLIGGFLFGLGRDLRGGGGKGSTVFLVHLTSIILFGPFWGLLPVVITTLPAEILKRSEPIRVLFNLFQLIASTGIAALVYTIIGGAFPPAFLATGGDISALMILSQGGAFLAASASYFLSNSLLVSGVIAISSEVGFLGIWRKNTFWVFGYDVVASHFALLIAWGYLRLQGSSALSRLMFLLVCFVAAFVRHLYLKLNSVQRVKDDLNAALEELELNMREQLDMMVKSIEARDPYTSGHSRRVAILSKAIALDLGLSGETVEEIENAALLHDVGKIHAEFAPLLQKEGRLTQEEWDLMKTHAEKSAELVGLFRRFVGNVVDSVRWHHERWDGKGYPDGLAGESIPLGARIIMVSDTIDAMTTDRPYRKALSFESVLEELIKYRSEQFDPSIVDVVTNSVSIRRLVTDPSLLTHYTSSRAIPRTVVPPIRSRGNLFDALRAGSSAKV